MKNIYKALAEFQYEVPVIFKDAKGYGYEYTPLSTIIEVITPFLKKHKLGYTQLIDGINLITILFHFESGEDLKSSIEMKQDVQLAKMNEYQVTGSAITYYRRYALSAILGLVTEKDTDGNGGQSKEKSSNADKSRPQNQGNEKPVFNESEFQKNSATVQVYVNKNMNVDEICKKILSKYGSVTEEAKALIVKMKPLTTSNATA